MKNHNLLTEGSVFHVLLAFSVPFLTANIIQALYGAVDLMVIGWYCMPESAAAVSTGTQVTQVITSMVSGLTLGDIILVGRHTGMKDDERTCHTIGIILSVFVIVALVLTIGVLIFRDTILTALRTPAVSMDEVRQYATMRSCGIFFTRGYNATSAVLRGYGDSRRPMYFVVLSCVLNIAGDIISVKYLRLGIAGTALATVLSQPISMICSVVCLDRKKFILTLTPKNLRIDRDRLKELAVVGIPISSQECMARLSSLYLISVTNRLGVNAAAVAGITSKYDVFTMFPATSTASAPAAIAAQNYGAGRPERTWQFLAAGIGFVVLAFSIFFLWAQLFPHTMIGLFNTSSEIIEAGIPFFQSYSFGYLAIPFVLCLNGSMNGRSKTALTMVSCCSGALVLRMPLIWLAYTYCPDNLSVIGLIVSAVSGFTAFYTLLFAIQQLKQDGIEHQKELTPHRA